MANGFLSPSPPPISPSSPPDHKVWVLCSSLLNIIHLSSLLPHLPMTGLGDLLTPLLTHFDWFSRFLSLDFSDSGCDQRKKNSSSQSSSLTSIFLILLFSLSVSFFSSPCCFFFIMIFRGKRTPFTPEPLIFPLCTHPMLMSNEMFCVCLSDM